MCQHLSLSRGSAFWLRAVSAGPASPPSSALVLALFLGTSLPLPGSNWVLEGEQRTGPFRSPEKLQVTQGGRSCRPTGSSRTFPSGGLCGKLGERNVAEMGQVPPDLLSWVLALGAQWSPSEKPRVSPRAHSQQSAWASGHGCPAPSLSVVHLRPQMTPLSTLLTQRIRDHNKRWF